MPSKENVARLEVPLTDDELISKISGYCSPHTSLSTTRSRPPVQAFRHHSHPVKRPKCGSAIRRTRYGAAIAAAVSPDTSFDVVPNLGPRLVGTEKQLPPSIFLNFIHGTAVYQRWKCVESIYA